jgi:hypothetical protein
MGWVTIEEQKFADGSLACDVKVGSVTIRCDSEKGAWTIKEAIDTFGVSVE